MANFTPQTFDINSINDGQKYEFGDSPTPETFNAPIEAAALLQMLATNEPDVSRANEVGKPSVSLEDEEGNPRFVFRQLKGEKGDKGEVGERGASGTSAVLENENHNSDINGYTQRFVNSNFSNPNLLLNGDFRVNQRGLNEYRKTGRAYTVDRWSVYVDYASSNYIVTPKSNGGVTIDATNSSERVTFRQLLEDHFDYFAGKTLTASIKIGNSIYWCTATIPATKPSASSIISYVDLPNSATLRIFYHEENQKISVNLYCIAGTKIDVDYMKLEFGSVATPFAPRPYAEELALCQRYYIPIVLHGMATVAVANGTLLYPLIPLPTPMRITPSITIETMPDIRGAGTYENTPISIAMNSNSMNGVTLTVNATNLQNMHTYALANGKAFLDAEVY